MQTGYFAGMLAYFYRETVDGQRLYPGRSFPLVPPTWLLVPPDAQASFERRFKQAHVGLLVAVAVSVWFVDANASTLAIFATVGGIAIAGTAIGQWWATRGLPRYTGDAAAIVPVRRFEMSERQARAMGPRGRIALIAAFIVLAIPQALVAMAQAYWFGWVGFALFAGAAGFSLHLHRRIGAA